MGRCSLIINDLDVDFKVEGLTAKFFDHALVWEAKEVSSGIQQE